MRDSVSKKVYNILKNITQSDLQDPHTQTHMCIHIHTQNLKEGNLKSYSYWPNNGSQLFLTIFLGLPCCRAFHHS